MKKRNGRYGLKWLLPLPIGCFLFLLGYGAYKLAGGAFRGIVFAAVTQAGFVLPLYFLAPAMSWISIIEGALQKMNVPQIFRERKELLIICLIIVALLVVDSAILGYRRIRRDKMDMKEKRAQADEVPVNREAEIQVYRTGLSANSRDRLFRQLLSGRLESPSEVREALLGGEENEDQRFRVLMLLHDYRMGEKPDEWTDDKEISEYGFLNMLREVMEGLYHILYTRSDPAGLLVVVGTDGDREKDAGLLEQLSYIGDVFEENYYHSITVGIGRLKASLPEIHESFQEAFKAAAYRIVFGRGRQILFQDIQPWSTLKPPYPAEVEESILLALRACEVDAVQEEVGHFFSRISKADLEHIEMALNRLLISLIYGAKQLIVDEDVLLEFSYSAVSRELETCEILEEKREIFLRMCSRIVHCRTRELKTDETLLIARVQKFIHLNYANPGLGMDMIVEYGNISPNNFRVIFKEYTEQTVAEYITDVRVERAKELLEYTALTTKEIAVAVGFENHRYFYSVFKGKMGCTATDYRKALAGK